MKAFIAAVTAGLTGASYYRTQQTAQAWGGAKPAFSQEKFQSYKLVEVHQETHDVKRFKFALDSPKTVLHLPVASCITLRYTAANGEEVMRPYTPLDLVDGKGSFELLIKCYPNSKMGSHLFSLKVGDTIDAKGPWPSIAIAPSQYNRIGMIAGGTGITPMYQVMRNVLSDDTNTTKLSLLFCNKTENDMLLTKDIDTLAKAHPSTFVVHHCLNTPPKRWVGYSGHINMKMIEETMPGPERKADSMILVSGPPGFMKAVCGPKDYSSYPPKQGALSGYLKEAGYDETCVYKF